MDASADGRPGMSTPVSLMALLKSDLERYYHYYGRPGRRVRGWQVWRNFLNPRCAPVALYRLARSCQKNGLSPVAKLLTWWNFFLFGVEISSNCDIGPYFFMPHCSGTVIGANRIGSYAVIYHNVTLGAKAVEPAHDERPVVGDHCFIASGAKIIGAIALGDDVTVGANAVVTRSSGSSVVLTGIPASERAKATDRR
jgi:serine O-acetyltransferase